MYNVFVSEGSQGNNYKNEGNKYIIFLHPSRSATVKKGKSKDSSDFFKGKRFLTKQIIEYT